MQVCYFCLIQSAIQLSIRMVVIPFVDFNLATYLSIFQAMSWILNVTRQGACFLPSSGSFRKIFHRGVQTNENLSLPQTILEEAIQYERFKMATHVAEFIILNDIVDLRDICEGSTDDTFVILCAVASLMYIYLYFSINHCNA